MPPSTRSAGSVDPGVGDHRVDELARRVGRRLERGARDVRLRVELRQAADHAARVGAPARRIEAGERRHDHAAVAAGHARGERLDVGRVLDQPEVVAQPLHERARDRDRALEHVRGRPLAQAGRRRR